MRLNSSGILRSVILVLILVLVLLAFSSLANPSTAILFLLSSLFAARLLYREVPAVRLCTMRNIGKSIAFSDDKKRRFIALSAVETTAEGATRFANSDSEMREAKILRATRILAEHIGSFGIEVDVKKEAVRYLTSAAANTVAEACQKAETLAERILRIVRELHGEDSHVRILEGENLQNIFKRIVGGEFETLTNVGSVTLRRKRGTSADSGFSLLTVTHESIGRIDLRRLISIIRDLGADVTYVINMTAQRAYNENSLIDGVEQGQIWVFSSYFIVNEKGVNAIRDVTHRLKSNIENLTRGGILRIEKGSTTIREVGSILARSPIGKKLFLSNSQLIAHIYPTPH
nr:hypothetical protein [Candidatus Njordarchaeum guaymaensis]